MATDEELFREWQSGKASALATLVKRHHASLLAHLYRLLGDTQQAEDLVQETFFRLVRNARSYRFPQPFLPIPRLKAPQFIDGDERRVPV